MSCMNVQDDSERVLLEGANWKELRFYQKSEALYQMTFVFCDRFLPKHGDRTVDQMLQAARSGKQNIIEGSEDGKTSTEMELKLLNVARSSIHELREDFKDYLLSRKLSLWDKRPPAMRTCTTLPRRTIGWVTMNHTSQGGPTRRWPT